MTFSPDDIEIKEFVPTLRGYSRDEVRAFLRSVSDDVRRLEEQLAEARSQQFEEHTAKLRANPATRPADSSSTAVLPASATSGTVPAPAFASVPLADGRSIDALRDAISELTSAVRMVATGAVAPPNANSHLLAAFEPRTIAPPAGNSAAPDFSIVPTPAKEYNGPERRRADRPWADRATEQRTGEPGARPAPRDRGKENSEMISAFLDQALGRAPVTQVPSLPNAADASEQASRLAAVAATDALHNVIALKRAVS